MRYVVLIRTLTIVNKWVKTLVKTIRFGGYCGQYYDAKSLGTFSVWERDVRFRTIVGESDLVLLAALQAGDGGHLPIFIHGRCDWDAQAVGKRIRNGHADTKAREAARTLKHSDAFKIMQGSVVPSKKFCNLAK